MNNKKNKPTAITLDEALFANLNIKTEPTSTVIQKTVVVKQLKRDSETQIMFWIDKNLKMDLKIIATRLKTDVKQLLANKAAEIREENKHLLPIDLGSAQERE